MIGDEQLAEWTRDAAIGSDTEGLRITVIPALIAEVRRLRSYEAEHPCTVCHGRGSRAYPSTATWRGGIGGRAVTSDVCDACWGSGDAENKWTDLRQMRSQLAAVTRERDALREVVEQIAEGEGCYTHGYATNCDMECQAKARAALAKLDEVKPNG